MPHVPAEPPGRSRRRRWLARLILAAVLLPPAGHFAYTRWTARPARPADREVKLLDAVKIRPPARLDVSEELATALRAIPALPTLSSPTTAPAGLRWVQEPSLRTKGVKLPPNPGWLPSLSVTAACEGAWEPDRRFLQGQVVAYLQSPGCQAALSEVTALSSRPFYAGMEPGPRPTLPSLRFAANCLMARARMRMNAGDWQAALEDLGTCLGLARGIEDDSTCVSLRTACMVRIAAEAEFRYLAREYSFSPEQAEAFLSLLLRHGFDPRAAWAYSLIGEQAYILLIVDQYYTGARGGDGFYVLSAASAASGAAWQRGLNLFSPLYDSRTEVEAYHLRVLRQARRAIELPGKNTHQTVPPTIPRDLGPRLDFSGCTTHCCWHARVNHDTAIIALGLNAWRREHGAYPQRLDQLPEQWRAPLLGPGEAPDPGWVISYQAIADDYRLTFAAQPDLQRPESSDELLLVEAGP